MVELPGNPYLEQEVLSASPAKLRWLVIGRGVQLCRVIAELWRMRDYEQGDQWTYKLQDVLTELLSGVHGTDPLSAQVADLYVFMLKLLAQAKQVHSLDQLSELQSLLEMEAETWLLVQKDLGSQRTSVTGAPLPPGMAQGPFFQTGQNNATASNEGSLCIDA